MLICLAQPVRASLLNQTRCDCCFLWGEDNFFLKMKAQFILFFSKFHLFTTQKTLLTESLTMSFDKQNTMWNHYRQNSTHKPKLG